MIVTSHLVPANHPWRDRLIPARIEQDRAAERARVRAVQAALEKLAAKADVEPLDVQEHDEMAEAALVSQIVASATRRDFSGAE